MRKTRQERKCYSDKFIKTILIRFIINFQTEIYKDLEGTGVFRQEDKGKEIVNDNLVKMDSM